MIGTLGATVGGRGEDDVESYVVRDKMCNGKLGRCWGQMLR